MANNDKLKMGGDNPLEGGFEGTDIPASAGGVIFEDGELRNADSGAALTPKEKDTEADAEQGSDLEAANGDNAGEDNGDGEAADGGIEGGPSEAPEAADLGEFKDDERDKWDGEYLTKGPDGTVDLNLERLGAEWWKNALTPDKDGKMPTEGKLNAGTYDYIKKRFGVSDATIKAYEQGLYAQSKLKADEAAATLDKIVKDVSGGDEAIIASAIEWAKAGGYTTEQRAKFNKVRDSGDPDDIRDSLEVLLARYEKSGGKGAPKKPAEAPAPKKETRNVTANAEAAGSNAGKGETFANMAEYNDALKAARAKLRVNEVEGEKMRKEAMAKLARSPFYRQNIGKRGGR